MVKRAAKKAAKKKSALPTSISVRAAHVFAECAFATGQGIERHMIRNAGGRPYILKEGGRNYWLALHTVTIPKALRAGNDWDLDRDIVVLMAQKLGVEAATAALADPANAARTTVEVNRAHVNTASKIVSADPHCVKAADQGAGPYCTV